MDSAKLKKLTETEWKPAKCCLTCRFGEFERASVWGLCGNSENLYEHNKHKRTHQMPAHFAAVCNRYQAGALATELETFLKSEVTS